VARIATRIPFSSGMGVLLDEFWDEASVMEMGIGGDQV
jgi:hypothetical protein